MMSYQAVIRNSDDQLVVSKQVGMKISIQKHVFGIPPTYENVYVETHQPTTNENGLVSIQIGGGTVVGGNFAAIDWSDGEYYLKTETDPTGGSSYSITGKSQLLSVPYALYAKNAKTYKVGDFAHGGIVFWVDESGQHGLVCSKTDLSAGARWDAGTYVKTVSYSSSGKDNTLLIIAIQTPVATVSEQYAARLCNEYEEYNEGSIYNGWFLPSIEELTWMYKNREKINLTAVTNGGTAFKEGKYWSSTEFGSPVFAFYLDFYNGESGKEDKQYGFNVRAVRAF